MSLRQLAEKANIAYTYLSKIEKGLKPPPSDNIIADLAKSLFLGEDESLIFYDLAAQCKKSNNSAYLKAKTKVTITETKLSKSGNLWAKIPSGWLCIWEKDVDKKFVK